MATLEEILKLDSKSQLPHAKKSKTVASRVSTAVAPVSDNNISRPQSRLLMGCGPGPCQFLRGGFIP